MDGGVGLYEICIHFTQDPSHAYFFLIHAVCSEF